MECIKLFMQDHVTKIKPHLFAILSASISPGFLIEQNIRGMCFWYLTTIRRFREFPRKPFSLPTMLLIHVFRHLHRLAYVCWIALIGSRNLTDCDHNKINATLRWIFSHAFSLIEMALYWFRLHWICYSHQNISRWLNPCWQSHKT